MTHKSRIVIVAATSAMALGLSACGGGGSGDAGGDGPISIGILAELTGATSDVGAPYNEGMLAYIDKLNADGGIDGREIDPMSND